MNTDPIWFYMWVPPCIQGILILCKVFLKTENKGWPPTHIWGQHNIDAKIWQEKYKNEEL